MCLSQGALSGAEGKDGATGPGASLLPCLTQVAGAVWSRQGIACSLFFLIALHHTYVNCIIIAR